MDCNTYYRETANQVYGVVVDDWKLNGKPRIAGTGLSVACILRKLASGETPKEIADEYRSLNEERVMAELDYAALVLDLPLAKEG